MADIIQKTDSLNDGRVKLNEAIKDADTAKVTAKGADVIAGQARQIAQSAVSKADSTQTQLDTIVINGDSSVEAAQARVDVGGEAHVTLKARLDAEQTAVTTQLAETAGVRIEDFGVTGTTDDSQVFVDALIYCAANGYSLLLTKDTYIIDSEVIDVRTPPIIGIGENPSEIRLTKKFKLVPTNGFKLQNVTFKNSYGVEGEYLFYTELPISNVEIKKVKLLNNTGVTNGTIRTNGLFRFGAKHLVIDDVEISGSPMGFVIWGSEVEDVTINNVRFYNYETGIYMTRRGGISPKNIRINDIKGINTAPQQTNHSRFFGSDLFMFEWVDDVIITNVDCDRAIERVGYFNCCNNVKIDGATTYNTDVWKFVGNNRPDASINYIARGFELYNSRSFGGVNGDVDRGLSLYDCEDIIVDNFTVIGNSASTPQFDSMFFMQGHVGNIRISRVKGKNFKRGFINNTNAGWESTPERCNIRGLSINDVDIENPVLTSFYSAINLNVLTPYVGYQFENFNFNNLQIKQTVNSTGLPMDNLGFANGSRLTGLIDVDRVNGLRSSNNRIDGFGNRSGWYRIGANSKDVVIEDSMSANVTTPSTITNLHVSEGSNITFLNEGIATKMTVNYVGVSPVAKQVVNVVSHAQIEVDVSQSLTSGASFLALLPNSFKMARGTIRTSTGEHMDFIVNPQGIIVVSKSANMGTVSVEGVLVLAKHASEYLVFINRTASTIYADMSLKVTQ